MSYRYIDSFIAPASTTLGMSKPLCRESGFGMIEILIALLIMGVGLLGMASLQSRSLSMTTDSQNRSQAILLANDIIERARANHENAGSYVIAADTNVTCDKAFTIDSSKSVFQNDVAAWRNELACLLPGGAGVVAQNSGELSVTVTWDSDSNDPSSTNTPGRGQVTVSTHI